MAAAKAQLPLGAQGWLVGGSYEGDRAHDIRHGAGTYSYSNPHFAYTGEWVNGKKHGHGRLTVGCSVYEGSFVDGEIEGTGVQRWADGSSYNGEWRQGEREGYGVFSGADGSTYEGTWKRNVRVGTDDCKLTSAAGDVFSGGFVANKQHGTGVEKFANGDVFTGGWLKGVKSGSGALTCANGDSYSGGMKNGRRHGVGKGFVQQTGVTSSGAWAQDSFKGAPLAAQLFAHPPEPDKVDKVEPPAEGEEAAPAAKADAASAAEGEAAEPAPPALDAFYPEAITLTAGESLPTIVLKAVLEKAVATPAVVEEEVDAKKAKKKPAKKGSAKDATEEPAAAPPEPGKNALVAEGESGRLATLFLLAPEPESEPEPEPELDEEGNPIEKPASEGAEAVEGEAAAPAEEAAAAAPAADAAAAAAAAAEGAEGEAVAAGAEAAAELSPEPELELEPEPVLLGFAAAEGEEEGASLLSVRSEDGIAVFSSDRMAIPLDAPPGEYRLVVEAAGLQLFAPIAVTVLAPPDPDAEPEPEPVDPKKGKGKK